MTPATLALLGTLLGVNLSAPLPAVAASLILGFDVTAPITPLGALSLAGAAYKIGPKAVRVQQFFDTPKVRAWAARNGEYAIRLQPGIQTER